MTFTERIIAIAREAELYIQSKLDDNPEYIIGTYHEEYDDDDDEENYDDEGSIFEDYTDDGHYTTYRLIRAYKDNEVYFIEGRSDDGDEFQFWLETLSSDTLCGVADKISTLKLKE